MIEFGKENREMLTPPFLVSIADVNAEIFRNTLKIVIAIPRYGEKSEGVDKEEDKIFHEAIPVYPDADNMYEIVFEDYVAYQSTNEYYAGKRKDDFSGRYLVIYGGSGFLNDILEETVAKGYAKLGSIEAPLHYGIFTESHIIDVVSHIKPIIKKI
ncbi:MAG: hypothetical protein E7583_04735 [Ruminococcaceae bacterium]|nr:hypothetical protein [Oscillospiraceae bacterium]